MKVFLRLHCAGIFLETEWHVQTKQYRGEKYQLQLVMIKIFYTTIFQGPLLKEALLKVVSILLLPACPILEVGPNHHETDCINVIQLDGGTAPTSFRDER